MNFYIFLANVVVFFHLAYVAFVVIGVPVILLGGLLKWQWVRNFWFRMIHFAMMFIVVVETSFGVTCPLTEWERDLRIAGEQLIVQKDENGQPMYNEHGKLLVISTDSYDQDFVGRCLQRILFFDPADVSQNVLNLCYFIFGGLVLLTLFLVPPRWPRKKATQTVSANAARKAV